MVFRPDLLLQALLNPQGGEFEVFSTLNVTALRRNSASYLQHSWWTGDG
jgi:hypothetical protein